MPVLTDPRQIVEPLPACLMEEIPDATVSISRASASQPSRAVEKSRATLATEPRAPSRILEAEAGNQPSQFAGAAETYTGREIRDQLWRHKVLVECWSLSKSQEFRGELDPMTPETKELCQQELILWAARERDRDKWMAFE